MAAGLLGGVALAQGGEDVFFACLHDGRVTGPVVANEEPDCNRNQTLVSWNASGPQGAQGPAGADGQDGADGVDGQDGADGADGQDGADGVDGQDGADGQDGVSGWMVRTSQRYTVGAAPAGGGYRANYVWLNCPGGRVALGGGIQVFAGGAADWHLKASHPHNGGVGWRAGVGNYSTNPQEFEVYAICAYAN